MSLNSLPTSTICGPTSGTLMVKKQKILSGPEKVSGPRLYRTHIPIPHSSPKASEPDSSASCWDLRLSSPHFGSFLFFCAWKSFSSSLTSRHFLICQDSCWKVKWLDLSSWGRVVCFSAGDSRNAHASFVGYIKAYLQVFFIILITKWLSSVSEAKGGNDSQKSWIHAVAQLEKDRMLLHEHVNVHIDGWGARIYGPEPWEWLWVPPPLTVSTTPGWGSHPSGFSHGLLLNYISPVLWVRFL